MGSKASYPKALPQHCAEEIDMKATIAGISRHLRKEILDIFNFYSIFPVEETKTFGIRSEILGFIVDKASLHEIRYTRAVGSLLTLAVGDSWGHLFEFQPFVRSSETHRTLHSFTEDCWAQCSIRGNSFHLHPGQWTDDTSMALCLADSLLTQDLEESLVDLIDLRGRFALWWFLGYNNAFRWDSRRTLRTSIGLGGNISESLFEFLDQKGKEGTTKTGSIATSGNGGLMRLAPVAIYYHDNLEKAMEAAASTSLSTHQGVEAQECAQVLAYILVKAINYEKVYTPEDPDFAQDFLDSLDFKEVRPFLQTASVMALIDSKQEDGDFVPDQRNLVLEDKNWDWKTEAVVFSPTRLEEDAGYFGSYALDAMKIALYCLYHSDSLEDTLLTVINLRGDADTTAAIAGQMAGALYGFTEIPRSALKHLFFWDNNGEIALRAIKLFNKEKVTLSPRSS